jgi:hypothetical protein
MCLVRVVATTHSYKNGKRSDGALRRFARGIKWKRAVGTGGGARRKRFIRGRVAREGREEGTLSVVVSSNCCCRRQVCLILPPLKKWAVSRSFANSFEARFPSKAFESPGLTGFLAGSLLRSPPPVLSPVRAWPMISFL